MTNLLLRHDSAAKCPLVSSLGPRVPTAVDLLRSIHFISSSSLIPHSKYSKYSKHHDGLSLFRFLGYIQPEHAIIHSFASTFYNVILRSQRSIIATIRTNAPCHLPYSLPSSDSPTSTLSCAHEAFFAQPICNNGNCVSLILLLSHYCDKPN